MQALGFAFSGDRGDVLWPADLLFFRPYLSFADRRCRLSRVGFLRLALLDVEHFFFELLCPRFSPFFVVLVLSQLRSAIALWVLAEPVPPLFRCRAGVLS